MEQHDKYLFLLDLLNDLSFFYAVSIDGLRK